jgi:hypothetical protein
MPHVFADLVSSHHFPAAPGQELEDLERLRRQLEQIPSLA